MRERGAKLNQDALKIMPYTDAVIKEALRLGAIINIVPKRALKTFEIGGYTIPKVSLRAVGQQPSCRPSCLYLGLRVQPCHIADHHLDS